MNVFLMYRAKDFDMKQPLPSNQYELIQDLELDTLLNVMARDDKYLFDTARQVLLSSLQDVDEIRYRQDVLKDCLNFPSVIREIYNIPIESITSKHRHWLGIFTRYPSGILSGAIEMLDMFVELLKKLKRIADENIAQFESEGFKRFFAMIQRELTDEYFLEVETHLKRLRFKRGTLISVELGMGNEGTNYLLRKPNHEDLNWFQRAFTKTSPVYSFTLHPRDDHGARALGELRDKGIRLVANALGQSADHIDNFLNTLRQELAFYIGCLNLQEELEKYGEPVCIPDVFPANERKHSFVGLYDISLALTMKRKVIGNVINADEKDLVVITGANQGGKSTFLRSIGVAQLMTQCGMFAPAKSFSANIARGVFTHYKREEDSTMQSGKFDEELSRMSEIVDTITPDSLILFNESFAATNEREGSGIASQIVRALLEKRIKVFYVTHLYQLARGFYEKNEGAAIFLRAERQRSFKLVEGEPLQTSFGADLYEKIFR